MKKRLLIQNDGSTSDVFFQRQASHVLLRYLTQELDFQYFENSAYLLLTQNDHIFHITLLSTTDTGEYHFDINGEKIGVHVINPKTHAPEAPGKEGALGPQVLKANMPGRVVRILVTEGQDIEKDQAVLVLEAMKMENEMSLACAGRIRSILVREGDTVEGGQKLVELEP